MGLLAITALILGGSDSSTQRSDAERSAAIAATIACPECDGQPVGDSNAVIAEVIRAEIKQQVDQGMTDREIREIYVKRYGEWVDLTPSRSGLTGMVWIVPFLVIGVAIGALALAFARWSDKGSSRGASAKDHQLVELARQERSGPEEL